MRGALLLAILGLVALLGTGCTQSPQRTGPAVVEPTLSPGQQAVAEVLDVCVTLIGPQAADLVIELDPDDAPRAFCRTPDRLIVTVGLIETLPKAELAAALAHELGHLVNGGHLDCPAGLIGSGADTADEAAADRTALRLLQSAGYQVDALGRLLARLIADPTVAPATRQALMLRYGQLMGS